MAEVSTETNEGLSARIRQLEKKLANSKRHNRALRARNEKLKKQLRPTPPAPGTRRAKSIANPLPRDPSLPYSRAELAQALGRNVAYVSMMYRAGCPKIASGRASLNG